MTSVDKSVLTASGGQEPATIGRKTMKKAGDEESTTKGQKKLKKPGDEEPTTVGQRKMKKGPSEESTTKGQKLMRNASDEESTTKGQKKTKKAEDEEPTTKSRKKTKKAEDEEPTPKGQTKTKKAGDEEPTPKRQTETKKAGDEEPTPTGQTKTKKVGDEEPTPKGQTKMKTAGDVKTVSSTLFKDSSTKLSGATTPDESQVLRLSELPNFVQNYSNAPSRSQRDEALYGDHKPKLCRLTRILGIVCSIIVIIAIIYAILTGLQTECDSYWEAVCSTRDATCSKWWWKNTCTCKNTNQLFHDKGCQYPCDLDPHGFCPGGACYMAQCFPDAFAFVSFLYSHKCKETATNVDCTVTCAEIIQHVCPDNESYLLFCNTSEPRTFNDFSCQRPEGVNAADGFIALTPDGEKKCAQVRSCKAVMTLYPCLAGYVSRGSIVCSRKCVVPKGDHGEARLFNGYCFLKKASCDRAMTTLMDTLQGSEIGYPFTPHTLSHYSAWMIRTLKIFPDLSRLFYPLMLAFGVLGEEGKVNTDNDANLVGSVFNDTLQDVKKQKILKSLYKNNKYIIEGLLDRIRRNKDVIVSKDRLLRVAYLVLWSNCKTFNECPAIDIGLGRIVAWATDGAAYCSLSRALFTRNFTVKATWCEFMARLQDSPQFSTNFVSFMHSPYFVSSLISQSKYVIEARSLDNDVFNKSKAICDRNESTTVSNSEGYIILPMALLDILGWTEHVSKQPKRISGFALILANAVSVRKAICNEKGDLPSIDCELRLYFTFLAFLPEPSTEEKKLIASGDKASLYFTLRAAARRQLLWGSRVPHFNATQKPTANNSVEIAEAAKQFAQCFKRIPH